MWNVSVPDAQWVPEGDLHLDGLVREVLDQDVVAIDTETTGLSVWGDHPLYWSMAWGNDRRVAMPIETTRHFRQSFAEEGKRWVFANAKFDMHMLANAGIEFAGECVDTQVMHALLYEEEPHGLKEMAGHVLGWRWSDFFDAFPPLMVPDETATPKILKSGAVSQKKRRETLVELFKRVERDNLSRLVDYASNDAYGTLRIYEKLKEELYATPIHSLYRDWLPTMGELFFHTEAPFTKVLWTCERNGVYVDAQYLESLREPIEREMDQCRREAVAITKENGFNIGSDDQMRWYLFDKLQLRPVTWTKGGKKGIKQPSVDSGTMEFYASEVPLCKVAMRFSDLEKTLNTYIKGLSKHMDPQGRVHCRLNQDIARTGRLSSSNPNLQNIPKPESDNFKLRGAFRASPGSGCSLLVNDYEQLEMRLLAAATVTSKNPLGAQEMIQIFLEGKDIHMGNAAMVYGPIYEKSHGWRMSYDDLVSAKKIDKKVKGGELPGSAMDEHVHLALTARNAIKSVGFGLNYGMKEAKLARQLGISKEEAVAIIDAYLDTYPAVKGFYADAIDETRKDGFSFSLLGRRRFHGAINSQNAYDRWSDERKCVNMQIQGTAADVVRLAMIFIHRAGLDKKFGCRMLLQVHDELVFECPDETIKEAQAAIGPLMEHALAMCPSSRASDLLVPLTTSTGIGPSWLEAK